MLQGPQQLELCHLVLESLPVSAHLVAEAPQAMLPPQVVRLTQLVAVQPVEGEDQRLVLQCVARSSAQPQKEEPLQLQLVVRLRFAATSCVLLLVHVLPGTALPQQRAASRRAWWTPPPQRTQTVSWQSALLQRHSQPCQMLRLQQMPVPRPLQASCPLQRRCRACLGPVEGMPSKPDAVRLQSC
jgi:hypothetical protein